MTETSPPAGAHDELAAAAEAVAEDARLTARVERAHAAVAEASERARRARDLHARESGDVAALESFSAARIWASLRGERVVALDRERAEEQAASYAVAQAEADVARARAELDASTAARAALGDVRGRHEQALARVEAELLAAGGPRAQELAQVADDLGACRSAAHEVREALRAAQVAHARLVEAGRMLESARGWATYDTFFNGGMLADHLKYQRVDAAEQLLRQADAAVHALAVELADVGMAGAGGVGVDDLARTFDVWFDNLFSDWSVRDRIVRAAERTGRATQAVADTSGALQTRLTELQAEEAALHRRREQLATGG